IAEKASQIPASLGSVPISGATVAMRANPSDPASRVLLVTGGNSDELLTAAMALVLHGDTWQGPQVPIRNLALPPPRRPDDAPLWLSTDKDRIVNFGQLVPAGGASGDLQGDGSTPLTVSLRLPPDLDLSERQNLAFHLNYRYNGVPLANGSTLQVFVNGAFVSSTPMPHSDKASSVLETIVPVPSVDLRPFANVLELKFMFQPAVSGNC